MSTVIDVLAENFNATPEQVFADDP
jgi:hypothetical protein